MTLVDLRGEQGGADSGAPRRAYPSKIPHSQNIRDQYYFHIGHGGFG